uniref:Uncharacterized protein n=1 Tax=Musca domestica TaxID=7370 RepID=A0A1I8N2M8_MUSDO
MTGAKQTNNVTTTTTNDLTDLKDISKVDVGDDIDDDDGDNSLTDINTQQFVIYTSTTTTTATTTNNNHISSLTNTQTTNTPHIPNTSISTNTNTTLAFATTTMSCGIAAQDPGKFREKIDGIKMPAINQKQIVEEPQLVDPQQQHQQQQQLINNSIKSDSNNLVSPLEDNSCKDKQNLLHLSCSAGFSENLGTLDAATVRLTEYKTLTDLPLLDAELKMLLQKLPINNPFYRFHKQSLSFRDHTSSRGAGQDNGDSYKTSFMCLANLRKFKSDTDLSAKKENQNTNLLIFENVNNSSVNGSCKPNDFNNSTVITNPFSIFHDDETQLTLTVDKRLRCASSASRRVAKKPMVPLLPTAAAVAARPYVSQSQLASYHHLYGVPIKHFERQDFPPSLGENTKKWKQRHKMATSSSSSSVFKQISLKKSGRHTSNSSSNLHQPNGPHLKKLKISYPDRTSHAHMATSMTSSSSSTNTIAAAGLPIPPKSNYFHKLQAKTRQGLQKLKDKCRQFHSNGAQAGKMPMENNNGSLNFKTMAKVESFRFISDKDNIRNYETKCLQQQQQQSRSLNPTLYKSYKSELDLSKNLNYLENYLQQNFDNNKSTSPSGIREGGVGGGGASVGRLQGQKLRRAFHQVSTSSNDSGPQKSRQHKRSLSTESPKKLNRHNYENLQQQPQQNGVALQQTDSLSSSDYASVFSGNYGHGGGDGEQRNHKKTDHQEQQQHQLRYEHPKMCEYLFENKSPKSPRRYNRTSENSEILDLIQPPQRGDEELDEDELSYNEELLRISHNKEQLLAYDSEYPSHGYEESLTPNNVRILINNSEGFDEAEDWYLSRSETDNISEVAFYQSLNDQLQQELEEPHYPNDPFDYNKAPLDTNHLDYHKDLYPFASPSSSELLEEDQCQLISKPASQRLTHFNYSNANKSYHKHLRQRISPHQYGDYEENDVDTPKAYYNSQDTTGPPHVGQNSYNMAHIYKSYKTSLSNSSSSTSSIHQQQQQQQSLYGHKYPGNYHHKTPSPSTAYNTPGNYNLGQPASSHIRRPSNASNTSSSDNFDNFIQIRSNGGSNNKPPPSSSSSSANLIQKRASSSSNNSYYNPRSPNAMATANPPPPPLNILNYYGAGGAPPQLATPDSSGSMPCYSVPHKMNSSSSSSNHSSSKLSNSSTNSNSSAAGMGSHLMTASLLMAAGTPTAVNNSGSSSSSSAAPANPTIPQMNLSKLYNNPITVGAGVSAASAASLALSNNLNATSTGILGAPTHLSSTSSAAASAASSSSSYPYEKRDKFILEYEC